MEFKKGMRAEQRNILSRILGNESGQMSIFIALIFQILFVFFAMVINVGLLVHDKINLQNAVDLGAYYAAERQAEVLNEIAHVNYQIRQDYKLLTWRYRVLGTIGSDYPAPRAVTPAGTQLPDDTFQGLPQGWAPAVCVSNQFWSDFAQNSKETENYCRNTGVSIPRVPDVPVIAPFIPGVIAAAAFAKVAQQTQARSCNEAGTMNWAYMMQIIYGYKMAMATRKTLIYELRKRLTATDPIDQQLQSVKTGVLNTIKKNLTEANSASFQDGSFSLVNGLSLGGCGANEGDATITEIHTAPRLMYLGLTQSGSSDCVVQQKDQGQLPNYQITKWDPTGVLQYLAQGEPSATGPDKVLFSSLGFEKNPWCMAYMAVKAATAPYKPFLPMGSSVQLVARAFAQPFGGRIGPWYMDSWPSGAKQSSGARVDPLNSPRALDSGQPDMSGIQNPTMANLAPNYSRYPGDHLGLLSQLSLGAQRHFFPVVGSDQLTPRPQRFRLAYYGSMDGIPKTGDPLPWDTTQNDMASQPQMVKSLRGIEAGAVAPDLFDATYYSVEPNYFSNYLRVSGRFANLPQIMGTTPVPPPDIGGRNGVYQQFNITNQVSLANNQSSGGGIYPEKSTAPDLVDQLYYLISGWHHLLTGWIAYKTQDYTTFPSQLFGTCNTEATLPYPVPGSCAQGGRTGYSVRLISREHLLTKWTIGGPSAGSAPIVNPPDPLF